jgi:hypothetical protein
MSSYGDAVGQERFILTEDQKYTNSVCQSVKHYLSAAYTSTL